MAKPADNDSGDTVRVERVGFEDTPSTHRGGKGSGRRGSVHVPAPEDLTPLPPPAVQASMIADESGLKPLPLPPMPEPTLPGAGRPLERASLGPRHIALPGAPTVAELTDPADAQWTLVLRVAGIVVGSALALWAGMMIVRALPSGSVPTVAVAALLGLLLLYPGALAAEWAIASRVTAGGIGLGPDQLPDEWKVYVDVAVRLGVRQPRPLYVYDGSRWEKPLLPLVRRRLTLVPRAAFASPESLRLALGRELGLQIVGHGTPLDAALLLPARLLFGLIAYPLRWVGLGLSPFNVLDGARVFTADRAACVGAGQLGLVVDDIIGAGDRAFAARVDVSTLEAASERVSPEARAIERLTDPLPAPARRVKRLQAFAAPHLED